MTASFILLACVVATTVSVVLSGASWPSTLKRCSKGDPNMDKCLLKLTQMALPKIAKGIPALGLKPVDPLRNTSFSIVTTRGPVTLNLVTDNVSIIGPSKVQIKRVFYDQKTSTYGIEGLHNQVKLMGNYRLKGSILIFPLDSVGTFEFELRGGFANHTIKIANNVRDGTHGTVNFDLRTLKGMKANMKDSKLGVQGSKSLNKIINDNWNLISPTLWDPMESIIHDVYSKALRPLTSKFTSNDFFPSTKSKQSDVVSPALPVESHSYTIEY